MLSQSRLARHKLNNFMQSILLFGGMALVLALLGLALAGWQGLLWALLAGVILLFMNPRLSPRLLLRMYRARPLSQHEAPELYAMVSELARRAELPGIPVLYYVPSPVMNAFTLGRSDDAAIAVTDGLLRRLSPRELTGVLAHEISHVANNDMWVMGLADLVSRVTGTLSLFGQVLVLVNLPLVLMGGHALPWPPLILLLVAPSISALLQLALSRTREFDADLDGAELTGDPAGLASALQKLERYQGGLLESVMLPGRKIPDPSLLRTHPKTEERVQRLLSLSKELSGSVRPPLALSEFEGGPGRSWGAAASRRPRWHYWNGLWY